jgi:hypothetical protein
VRKSPIVKPRILEPFLIAREAYTIFIHPRFPAVCEMGRTWIKSNRIRYLWTLICLDLRCTKDKVSTTLEENVVDEISSETGLPGDMVILFLLLLLALGLRLAAIPRLGLPDYRYSILP